MENVKKYLDYQIKHACQCYVYCLEKKQQDTADSFMSDLKILYTLLILVEENE